MRLQKESQLRAEQTSGAIFAALFPNFDEGEAPQ